MLAAARWFKVKVFFLVYLDGTFFLVFGVSAITGWPVSQPAWHDELPPPASTHQRSFP